jgi:hypothetical protein
MKSRWIASGGDANAIARKVAREEIEKQMKERCPQCEQSIANQVAAVMCKALNVRYGFGKERLRQLIADTENLFELCAIDGKRFNAVQAVEWLRDAMGIDLNKP